MHAGVERDEEKQRIKRERQADFEMQKRLEEEYRKIQNVPEGQNNNIDRDSGEGSWWGYSRWLVCGSKSSLFQGKKALYFLFHKRRSALRSGLGSLAHDETVLRLYICDAVYLVYYRKS